MRLHDQGKQACSSARWFAAIFFLACGAHAADMQDAGVLQRHAEQFLKAQTTDQPGKVSVQVKRPDVSLPACAALDAFQPVGGRRIGKISVGVRCRAPTQWTVYLSAQIEVVGAYAVARQSLPANHVLTDADIGLAEGDLGRLPADVVTDVSDIVGYRTVSGIAAGAPLRNAVVRPPLVVQQGQTTRVVLNGPGFSVQNEGQALANASRGERVRVRIRSGQVVSGIAQDGQQVMVAF
ncbi:MAG: flagellar basal body P-ring formation protein FlgA [Thiobacillus sp.]|nr:flagellar basal body P-ring formation protein FlgA [Thiobacillus sp.]